MKTKLLIGSLLSVFFLWLAFRNAHLEEVLKALATVRVDLVLLTVLFTLAAYFLRAWRWHFLLLRVKRIGIKPLWNATMIGFMGNNLFPARLGELWRAYLVGKSAGISRSSALASIVIERLFDTFVLLCLFGGVLASHRLPEKVRGWGLYLIWVSAPIYALLILLRLRPSLFYGAVERFAPKRLRPRAKEIVQNFREGLGVLGHPSAMLWSLVLSAAMWGALVAVVALCFASLRLELPTEAGVVVLVVMAIGTMVPSAPGFVGTLQYAGTLALKPYGVDPSLALTFTLVYHASQWVPTTLVGMLCFAGQHLSLKEVPGISPSGPTADGSITAVDPKAGTSDTKEEIGR